MSTEAQAPAATFKVDDEVTLTVTGRVVADSPAGTVVEYLTAAGWIRRIAVRPDAPAVDVTAAEPPSAEEVERRRDAYRRMGTAFSGDPEERARIFAEAPYGGIATEEASK